MNLKTPLAIRAIFRAFGLVATYFVNWLHPEFMDANMTLATNLAMGGVAVMMLGMALWPGTENPWFIKLMFLETATFLVGVTAIMGIGEGPRPFPSFPSFLFFTSILFGLSVLYTPSRHLSSRRPAV